MASAVQSRVSSKSHRPVIETAATEKEARRVLEWQHEVARSVVTEEEADAASQYTASTHRPETRRYESYPQPSERPPMRLVRRVTETTETYPAAPAGNVGMSGKAILGTLLGAAAGAAVAYAMVRSEEPEYVIPPAPLQRRSSVAGSRPVYSTYGIHSPAVRVVERIEMEPARTYVSARDNTPRYVPGCSVAPSMPPMSGRSDMHRIEDRRRDGERFLNNDASVVSGRSRRYSDAGSHYGRPLTILPAPAKSHVSHSSSSSSSASENNEKSEAGTKVAASRVATSVHSKAAPSVHSKAMSVHSKAPTVHSKAPSVHSKAPTVHSKAPSKAPSTRSHVSGATTIKPSSSNPPAPTAKSKVSTTTIRFVPSGSESKVSARHVALPKSVVSGAGYERSIAPSDSVSNAGSRRSRR